MVNLSGNLGQLLKRITPRIFALTLGILFLDAFLISACKMGWIDTNVFSVLIGPPVEEALKAGLACIFGVFLLSRFSMKGSTRFSLATIFALAGIASGVVFALNESLAQGEPLGALFSGLYVHLVLTTGVSIACWSLIFSGNKQFLIIIFPLAAVGHASWNYLVLHPSPATETVTLVIFITIIALTTWKYLNLRSGSSARLYNSFLETA